MLCLINDLSKIWFCVPYPRRRGEHLVKACIKKIRRYLKEPVNFIVIYNTKKISYFLLNKDKIPDLSKVVHQVLGIGCGYKYISKTDRCLHKRLSEQSTLLNASSVVQYFQNCQNAQHLIKFNNLYDRQNDDNILFQNNSDIKHHVFNNFKILHYRRSYSPNILLILESLLHQLEIRARNNHSPTLLENPSNIDNFSELSKRQTLLTITGRGYAI